MCVPNVNKIGETFFFFGNPRLSLTTMVIRITQFLYGNSLRTGCYRKLPKTQLSKLLKIEGMNRHTYYGYKAPQSGPSHNVTIRINSSSLVFLRLAFCLFNLFRFLGPFTFVENKQNLQESVQILYVRNGTDKTSRVEFGLEPSTFCRSQARYRRVNRLSHELTCYCW